MFKFICKKCGKNWYSATENEDKTCSDCGGKLELVEPEPEKPEKEDVDSNHKGAN